MRKIAVLLFLAICLFVNSACCDDMSGYRRYPFQFVYPEYNYKAPVTQIKNTIRSYNGLTKVVFFGLSAYIPSKYASLLNNVSQDKVIIKSGENSIVMTREKERMSGCDDEGVASRNKDFCSSFSSTKDLSYKLFTLTADEIIAKSDPPPAVGLLWIIHQKGILFQNTEKIHIYEGNGFAAFVQVRKDAPKNGIAMEVDLFHDHIAPEHISIGTNIKDDVFLNTFLASLEPEK